MKNRNLDHKDDWATPRSFYNKLDARFNFDFDPCPFHNDIDKFDGLNCEWGKRNFVNPPYSRKLKERFVSMALEQSQDGKMSAILIPVSTSTRLFHDVIQPNAFDIEFVERRIKFMGINSKGEYVNWDNSIMQAPASAVFVNNSGMHDSMVVQFGGEKC
jgi:hypothetical protein